jgi:hypothetical protein
MKIRRNNYTVLELLFVVVCVAIIMKMLMPAFAEARAKARFTRWLGFNRQCSSDPACVINLNFQDGTGSTVTNTAAGHENSRFNAKEYSGIVKGNYKWTRGRWWKGKKALQFNGVNTMIEFPLSEAIDFGEDDSFTILIWVKFDRFRRWDGLYGKCYQAIPPWGYGQYDLYYDGTVYTSKSAQGQFEVDVCKTCIGFDNVTIDDKDVKTPNITLDTINWFHIVLRNKVLPNGKNQVDVFYNGRRLLARATNNYVSTETKCAAKLIIGALRFRVDDRNGNPTLDGRIANYFQGRIDEFIMYKRALQDTEVMGHYKMGAETL